MGFLALLVDEVSNSFQIFIDAKELEERIWTTRVASKIVFPPAISVTRAPLHDERLVRLPIAGTPLQMSE